MEIEQEIEIIPAEPVKKRKKRTNNKKGIINMTTKTAKYFKYHNLDGLTKTEAVKKAGISRIENVTNIEKTATYQALTAKYADTIQKVISMEEVAFEHTKNIVQDQDKGAKNKAIQMFLERVEPDVQKREEEDKLIIVLR